MAGIYIHIPFCASRCIYCGFYSTVRLNERQHYIDAVCREWQLRQTEITEPLETIYIGGGTPSQLEVHQLKQLFDTLPQGVREVTVECNPDDITEEFAAFLPELPVNRISMGAQTFSDERLQFLHRRHTASQVSQAVQRLRLAGIGNISIDLMYGFPNETMEQWQQDIEKALALQVEHLSAYCLMIEEGTPLYQMGIDAVEEETERRMYEYLIDRLKAAGYEHYEISNFARPGFQSQHNSSYWHDIPYIGLGAAAHSYNRKVRSWNVSNIQQYMKSIQLGKRPCEQELIDRDTHYNDQVTTALRTSDGLDLDQLTEPYASYCLKEAKTYLDNGLLRLSNNHLILTRKGLFVSDMVMSSLVWV